MFSLFIFFLSFSPDIQELHFKLTLERYGQPLNICKYFG